MQIMHPQSNPYGVSNDDVFIAVDEMGTQVGEGYLIGQYLPNRSPDRPINLYFDINSQPSGWYLIFGALVARARQMREVNPSEAARMYTRVKPGDTALLDTYRDMGLYCGQYESLVRLKKPEGDGHVPMGCQLTPVSLNTVNEQLSLIGRLQQNDITHIDLPYLQYMSTLPHFHALGLWHNNALVGEVLVAGSGDSCEIMAVYVIPSYRRQGIAKMLIHSCMGVMATEGVSNFAAVLASLYAPQLGIAHAFGGTVIETQSYYPELLL